MNKNQSQQMAMLNAGLKAQAVKRSSIHEPKRLSVVATTPRKDTSKVTSQHVKSTTDVISTQKADPGLSKSQSATGNPPAEKKDNATSERTNSVHRPCMQNTINTLTTEKPLERNSKIEKAVNSPHPYNVKLTPSRENIDKNTDEIPLQPQVPQQNSGRKKSYTTTLTNADLRQANINRTPGETPVRYKSPAEERKIIDSALGSSLKKIPKKAEALEAEKRILANEEKEAQKLKTPVRNDQQKHASTGVIANEEKEAQNLLMKTPVKNDQQKHGSPIVIANENLMEISKDDEPRRNKSQIIHKEEKVEQPARLATTKEATSSQLKLSDQRQVSPFKGENKNHQKENSSIKVPKRLESNNNRQLENSGEEKAEKKVFEEPAESDTAIVKKLRFSASKISTNSLELSKAILENVIEKRMKDYIKDIIVFKPNPRRVIVNQKKAAQKQNERKAPTFSSKQFIDVNAKMIAENDKLDNNHRRIISQIDEEKMKENQKRLEKKLDKNFPGRYSKEEENALPLDVKSYTIQRSRSRRNTRERSKTRSRTPHKSQINGESSPSEKRVKINVTFRNEQMEKQYEKLAEKAKDLDSLELEQLKRQDDLDFTKGEVRLKEKDFNHMMLDIEKRKKELDEKKGVYDKKDSDYKKLDQELISRENENTKLNEELENKENLYMKKNHDYQNREKTLEQKIKDHDEYNKKVREVDKEITQKTKELEKLGGDLEKEKAKLDREILMQKKKLQKDIIDKEKQQKVVDKDLKKITHELKEKLDELKPKDDQLSYVINGLRQSERTLERKQKEYIKKVKDTDIKADELSALNRELKKTTQDMKQIKPKYRKQKTCWLVNKIEQNNQKPVFKILENWKRALEVEEKQRKIQKDVGSDNRIGQQMDSSVQGQDFIVGDQSVQTDDRLDGDITIQTEEVLYDDKINQVDLEDSAIDYQKYDKLQNVIGKVAYTRESRWFNCILDHEYEVQTNQYLQTKIFGMVISTANIRHKAHKVEQVRSGFQKLKKNAGWSFQNNDIKKYGDLKLLCFILDNLFLKNKEIGFENIDDYELDNNESIAKTTEISYIKSETFDIKSISKDEDNDDNDYFGMIPTKINFEIYSELSNYQTQFHDEEVRLTCNSNPDFDLDDELGQKFSENFQKKFNEKLGMEIEKKLEEKFESKIEKALDQELLDQLNEEEKKGLIGSITDKLMNIFNCRKK